MEIQTQEARIILAIEAIQSSKKLSHWSAVKICNVPETTLWRRMAGLTACPKTRPNRQKLSELEETVLLWHILNIDIRGFIP